MGGTFDPVHFAHLRLALDALETLDLSAIRWIPSGQPGHRNPPQASAVHRLAMLRLALADEPRFHIDEAELQAREATYTVSMLTRLRAELGAHQPLVMLIGMDSFLGLNTWRDWRKLFELTHFAIAERPGFEFDALKLPSELGAEYAARAIEVDAPSGGGTWRHRACGAIVRYPSVPLAISATDLRARAARGRSTRYLIPETVVRYIESNKLYV
jgi:nicotinate-nucleotide adenylyltransferase